MAIAETTQETPAAGLTAQTVVYFDGRFVPLEQATVTIATHGLNYGTGCFEGIRAYWNAEHGDLYVTRLDEHVDRFFRSCGVLRIRPPFSRTEFREIVIEVLRQNEFKSDVYIRPIAFKSSQTIKLTLSPLDDSFGVYAFPMGYYAHREGGLRVALSAWRRIDDNAIPARAKVTGSYVNASLASDDAAQAGYDEAIMLNGDGTLAEASSSNAFLVRSGTLITPPVSDNILEGITREAVIALAREELHIPVEVREVGRTEIYVADEMFLTGTGIQVEPVVSVDGRPVAGGKPGPMTTQLAALYADAVHCRMPAYQQWCTPVYQNSGG
jgi:branched-chain amino acid aminotransferase